MSCITVRKTTLLLAIENFRKQKEESYQKKLREKMECENAKIISRHKFWSRFFPWIKLKVFQSTVDYEVYLHDMGVIDDRLIKNLVIQRVEKLDHLCYGSHPHVNLSKEDAWIMAWA
jgi:hypothetical protein